VWEWKQSGKNKQWVKVAGECMHVPFFLDDNTGRVLIDPRGADLDLHRDYHAEFNGSFFSMGTDVPPNVVSFLARRGVSTGNKIKVEEYAIKPKNSLFILGTLADNPGIEVAPRPIEDSSMSADGSSGFSLSIGSVSFSSRSGAGDSDSGFSGRLAALASNTLAGSQPQTIHLPDGTSPTNVAEMTQQQKVAAALMKAGISNPAAWRVGGIVTSGVQVIDDPSANATLSGPGNTGSADTASTANIHGFDPHPPVALMKGTNNPTFLISWRSQQEVARSLGWKCTLMIWGGPALTLVSLYFFLAIEQLL
jgi:hypothetical protein